MQRVAVFGMGYVGCVTAACLSRDGHQVTGVDVDEDKIAAVVRGVSPVFEPGLDDLIQQTVTAGTLTATTDSNTAVENSEIALVAVGTPSLDDGSVETFAVERVIESIGRSLRGSKRSYTVALRSTLLPGLLEEKLAPLLEQAADCRLGERIVLCNHPEFLRETTAIRDFDDPPFILVGAESAADAQPVLNLYGGSSAERIVTDTRTSALVKYACNAFHALKIDFANEIGALARSFGADGRDVMQIVCRDTRLNISTAYLKPGFAFGGSCLPKDVRALTRHAQQQALRTEVLNAILPSNSAHLERALKAIRETGLRRVGLVGLSFKAGTDDLRESPLVILAETLLGRGYDLKIYDPGVRVAQLTGTNLAYVDRHLPHLARLLDDNPDELYRHAELLILGTDVAGALDWQTAYTGEVFDLRRDLVVPTPAAIKTT
jgi:GDP-mannose 6-dehydrogenase